MIIMILIILKIMIIIIQRYGPGAIQGRIKKRVIEL